MQPVRRVTGNVIDYHILLLTLHEFLLAVIGMRMLDYKWPQ